MTRATLGTLFLGTWFTLMGGDAAGISIQEPNRAVEQRFLKGPLQVLTTNPRYFVSPNGKLVYLRGSHTQLSVQEREGHAKLSFEFLLSFLEEHRHNFTKLWIQEDTIHTPSPYQRTGSALALDGKPKLDLTKLNQMYFDQLRSRAIAAQERGIYVDVMLFNGWSVEGKSPTWKVWNRHPFHSKNNVNGIDGDDNGDDEGTEVHTLRIPAITAIQEAYVRKVVDTVNDLDNVLYEIVNEGAATLENTAWQYHMIDFIHEYERTKPKQHPVGMTVQWPNGNNGVLFDSRADWISPNALVDPPDNAHGKVILSDSDHIVGNSVEWVWKSFTRGMNPIFMDLSPPLSSQQPLVNAEEVRVAMGDTLEYVQRIDLANIQSRPEMCSTTFCLVNPGRGYLVYFPPSRWCSVPIVGRFYKCMLTVDLSKDESTYTVEWFNPDTKERQFAGTTTGGVEKTFIPPFPTSSLLYLIARDKGAAVLQ